MWNIFELPSGDKVNVLVHTYPHKPWRRLRWPYMQSPGWQTTLCVAQCLISWFASSEKYGHTWQRMSLLRPGVIKQPKPKHLWPQTEFQLSRTKYVGIPSAQYWSYTGHTGVTQNINAQTPTWPVLCLWYFTSRGVFYVTNQNEMKLVK